MRSINCMDTIPSTPVTPNPSMMFCVNLNGTTSGVSKACPCTPGQM